MDDDKDIEIRCGCYYELLCRNPREMYQNTRSYESLKQEYDLLHCNDITDEDLIKLYSMNRDNYPPFWPIGILGLIAYIMFLYILIHSFYR